MNEFKSQFEDHAASITEAEATLRLVARQPVPEGLTERVHGRLAQERRMQASAPEGKGFWHLWLPAHRLQFAGAAVLAAVIAISALSVRHPNTHAKAQPVPAPVQSGGFGGAFGTSAAQAVPKSLKPIPVPAQQTKKKKPSAAHVARRPVQNPAASEASATPTAP